MPKQHLDATDFENENSFQGRGLQGIDQAAIEAQDRLGTPYDMEPSQPYQSWEQRKKDYCEVESIRRHATKRGSACNYHKDMMGVPPRPEPKIHK